MGISKEKQEELKQRLKTLNIKDEDLIEKFIQGSGPGGQKVNKSSSTVYLKHIPTSIEVKCSEDRSQEVNRFLAKRKLCEQIEKQFYGIKTLKEKIRDKIKKQKKRKERKNKNKNC